MTDEEREAYWELNGALLCTMGYNEDPVTPSSFLPELRQELQS